MTSKIPKNAYDKIVAFENAPRVKRRDLLARSGIKFPDPTSLTDQQVHDLLWTVIQGLAHWRIYLHHTNHVSDRELYTLLIERVLDEETELVSPDLGWVCEIDIYEYGTAAIPDGQQVWLRYYADEFEREEWAEDMSEEEFPPHENPPFDRDRHLPRSQGFKRNDST